MELHSDWDFDIPYESQKSKAIREAIDTIERQLDASEWSVKHSADANYRLFARGSLRVRLTVKLPMIQFENERTGAHLQVDMSVDQRKALYNLFEHYQPETPSIETQQKADLNEWLSCVHENRYGREAEIVL